MRRTLIPPPRRSYAELFGKPLVPITDAPTRRRNLDEAIQILRIAGRVKRWHGRARMIMRWTVACLHQEQRTRGQRSRRQR